MTTANDLTRAKYAGRDFRTFFDDLKKKIQEEYGDLYNDFVESAVGVMLIDMMSWVGETLSFYLDRQASESYMETALTKTAVERLARQIGYKMYGAVSGSVDLSVTLVRQWPFAVTIPKGFKFKGPNDLIFEATQDVVFPSLDVGPKTVAAREGETKTQTFISDGSKNQKIVLGGVKTGQYLVEGTVVVRKDSEVWEEVEFLGFEQTNQFEVGYGAAPPVIRFGDGIAGNIPEAGAEIQVEYVAGSGKAGFAGSDTINDVVTTLRVSGNDIALVVTNSEPSSGASDGESILRTKRMAPGYFRARDVAVTRTDIEDLSSAFVDPQFGAVEKAQAFSIRDASSDGFLNGRLSTIRNAAEDSVPTVQAEVEAVETDLVDVKAATADVGTQADDIKTEAADASGQMDDGISDIQFCSNKQDTIYVDANDVQDRAGEADTEADAGKAAIDAISTAGTSQLTSADKAVLKEFFDNIKQKLALIDTEGANIISFASNSKTDCGNAIVDIQAAKERMTTIDVAADAIKTDKTTVEDEIYSVQGHLSTLEAAVVDPSVTINAACDEIFSHVDELLSNDCKANLVEVPILTLDPDGFYIGPSTALIRALQVYLDGRKEPTATLKVYSGETALVEVDVEVVLGVESWVVKPKAAATAETVIDGLLKGRKFGVSLYRSQVTDKLMDEVSGIGWVNVRLTYPDDPDLIDSYGNLIISMLQVVSKGDVTVTAVDAA